MANDEALSALATTAAKEPRVALDVRIDNLIAKGEAEKARIALFRAVTK